MQTLEAMPKQVIISYSSEDKECAKNICGLLEKHGIDCWIAPRDVTPGCNFGENIINAIDSTYAMVLVLSDNANNSIYVKNEVERAVSKGKTIFTIRIREVKPSKSLELFIAASQWIDAFTPPLEARVKQLAAAINELLKFQFTEQPEKPRDSKAKETKYIPRPCEVGKFKLIGERIREYINIPKKWLLAAGFIIIVILTAVVVVTISGRRKAFDPFPVWTEAESPDNHYSPCGFMGEISAIRLDQTCPEPPFSENSCIRISYFPEKQDSWAGVYWQYPINNWGDYRGHDLSGATRLNFWARGEKGGEKAEFKVGGIRDNSKPYQDSCGPLSTGIVTLAKGWNHYFIDVKGQDLSNIIGGFCWVTNRSQNPDGCTIYIDNIKYE